jgi:hypothetical protein
MERKKTITAKNLLTAFIQVSEDLKNQERRIEERFNILFSQEEEAKSKVELIKDLYTQADSIVSEINVYKRQISAKIEKLITEANKFFDEIEDRMKRMEGNNQAAVRLVRELKSELKKQGIIVSMETINELSKSAIK